MSFKELLKVKYPIMLIIILPVLIHLPVWLGIVDFYSGDASDLIPYFYGTKSLVYQSFQNSGEIPYWNPHIMFGQPVVGNIQYALFYPLNIIFMLVSFFNALPYYQIIHLIIAGSGTYMLCQYTGCKKTGSTISALLIILNGRIIYYINAGWLSYFSAICWLPFFIFLSLKVIKGKSLYNPIGLSIIFAMSFLSGTPQYAFFGFYLLIISGIIQLFHEKSKNDRGHLIFRIFLAGFLSFLITGIQMFPAMEQAYLSTRQLYASHSIGFHFDWDINQWIRILFRPELLRHDFTWELCAYMGIGGIILSGFGLLTSGKKPGLICVWGIIPWLFSMGEGIPLLANLTGYIPGLAALTNPSRYFIFSIIILTVLAGHGIEYLFSDRLDRKRGLILLSLISLGLIAAGIVIKPFESFLGSVSAHYFSVIIIFLILTVLYVMKKSRLMQCLILLWLVIDPAYISMGILLKEKYHTKDLEPPGKIISAIKNSDKYPRIASIQSKDAWNNNLLTPLEDWIFINERIDRASGYEPLGMLKSHIYAGKMDGTGPTLKSLWGYRLWSFHNNRLFDLAGITHLITSEPVNTPELKFIMNDTITLPHFHGGWWEKKHLYLYENINSYPRAFLMDNKKDFKITPVKTITSTPNTRRIIFQTDTPRLLVISESFHPGWVARSLDTELQIEPFLDNFISLKVQPGKYDIHLKFKPHSLFVGALFSTSGILLTIYFILHQYILDRKKEWSKIHKRM